MTYETIDTGEAARRLRLSVRRVRELCQAGRVRASMFLHSGCVPGWYMRVRSGDAPRVVSVPRGRPKAKAGRKREKSPIQSHRK